MFSSDGSEWLWSDYASGDQTASTTFYEGTQAHQVRKVGSVNAPFGTGAPQPITVRNGVVYVDYGIYGGDNIYDSGSSLSTLNLSRGKLTATRRRRMHSGSCEKRRLVSLHQRGLERFGELASSEVASALMEGRLKNTYAGVGHLSNFPDPAHRAALEHVRDTDSFVKAGS